MKCPGLHCAGCGKGIPAGIVVVIILVIAAYKIEHVAGQLADGLYWIAGAIVVSAIAIPLLVKYAFRSPSQCAIRWPENKPMITDLKAGADQWPESIKPQRWPYIEPGYRYSPIKELEVANEGYVDVTD